MPPPGQSPPSAQMAHNKLTPTSPLLTRRSIVCTWRTGDGADGVGVRTRRARQARGGVSGRSIRARWARLTPIVELIEGVARSADGLIQSLEATGNIGGIGDELDVK
eukprot:scaffold46031_cov27-Tisochrysis_lutea.AAC.1